MTKATIQKNMLVGRRSAGEVKKVIKVMNDPGYDENAAGVDLGRDYCGVGGGERR